MRLNQTLAFALLAGAALVGSASAGAEPKPTLSPAALRGQALASSHCAACHATGTSGDSPLAAAPPFRTLGRRYDPAMLQEAFAEGVFVGHSPMPQFELSPAEVADLVTYLQALQPARSKSPA